MFQLNKCFKSACINYWPKVRIWLVFMCNSYVKGRVVTSSLWGRLTQIWAFHLFILCIVCGCAFLSEPEAGWFSKRVLRPLDRTLMEVHVEEGHTLCTLNSPLYCWWKVWVCVLVKWCTCKSDPGPWNCCNLLSLKECCNIVINLKWYEIKVAFNKV